MINVFEEIRAVFKNWPIWYMLGSQDIKMRYRRSSIGPFWITISMAITIYSMGFLYGHLFNIELSRYFPFLASGIMGWSFLSTLLSESSNVFVESEPYIKNQESFMSLFVMRLILRNLIVFAHNLVVFFPIVIMFHLTLGIQFFLLLPALMIISINAFFWGNLLAIIGTRYRDFSQIVTSLIQVIFFLTPVMWMPNLLPEKYQWTILYNPFYHFLTLIRAPLLNQSIQVGTVGVVAIMTLMGFGLYVYFLERHKHKIVFWL